MKQSALCRFSKSAVKGSYIKILMSVLSMMMIFILRVFAEFAGAYFLCRYFYFYEAVLIWCGLRFILHIAQTLLSVSIRCNLVRRCILNISLPCGYERRIRKKLRRLYFMRGIMHFLCNVLFAGALLFGAWCIGTNSFAVDSVYRLMAAFQAVPAVIVLLWFRIKLSLCFLGAEVVCVVNTDESTLKNLLQSGKMLSGTASFAAVLFVRNIFRLLSPVFVQTLVTYFSVRHIEWQYQEKQNNEQTHICGKHKRTYEAGELSQT